LEGEDEYESEDEAKRKLVGLSEEEKETEEED